ncbi:MAG: hypothetical protein LBS00_00610 [Synergistaceae bacterium]|nr:hypothetical protein [Synergistaceae bacterium]
MKQLRSFLTVSLFALAFALGLSGGAMAASAAEVEKERPITHLGKDYIETSGVGVAPKNFIGRPQGKALARRGAIVDLQRNLLETLKGVQIDSRTTLDNFMADDFVRQEVEGMIKGVEILDGTWDGELYTVTGRVRAAPLLAVQHRCLELIAVGR